MKNLLLLFLATLVAYSTNGYTHRVWNYTNCDIVAYAFCYDPTTCIATSSCSSIVIAPGTVGGVPGCGCGGVAEGIAVFWPSKSATVAVNPGLACPFAAPVIGKLPPSEAPDDCIGAGGDTAYMTWNALGELEVQ